MCVFQLTHTCHLRTCNRVRNHLIQNQFSSPTPSITPHSWSRPSSHLWKLNFDGAWNANSNIGGVGWIIRDSLGLFCLAGARQRRANSAKENEIAALKDGLEAARGGGFVNLMVEGDAKELLDSLHLGNHDGDVFVATLMLDCLAMVPSFVGLSFHFAPRLCNSAAHMLAYWDKHSVTIGKWFLPPAWLTAVVSQEAEVAAGVSDATMPATAVS